MATRVNEKYQYPKEKGLLLLLLYLYLLDQTLHIKE